MKALTIQQPYAHLIAIGKKRVENRKWRTDYRGRIAIHAGKGRDYLCDAQLAKYPDMAFGAIVATARLVGCVSLLCVSKFAHQTGRLWLLDHEHVEGPACWILESIVAFDTPIPWKGRQGLFDIPDEAFKTKGGE